MRNRRVCLTLERATDLIKLHCWGITHGGIGSIEEWRSEVADAERKAPMKHCMIFVLLGEMAAMQQQLYLYENLEQCGTISTFVWRALGKKGS